MMMWYLTVSFRHLHGGAKLIVVEELRVLR